MAARVRRARLAEADAISVGAGGAPSVVRLADDEPTIVRVDERTVVRLADGKATVVRVPDNEPTSVRITDARAVAGGAGRAGLAAPSPTAATKPETPAPSASVPYSVEFAPRRGTESSDIVIRIRPGGIENAASTQRAAQPKVIQQKVAKKTSTWPKKAKLKALEPARLQAGEIP